MMLRIKPARCGALLLACLWFAVSLPAEVIFDNTLNYQTNYVPSISEHGDELVLAGTARTITKFEFEYFGAFLRTGDETARIRFYKNDGPNVDPRPGKTILAPGTLLYESGPFPIFTGINTVPLLGLNVTVPDVFTWTIQFGGLTGLIGDQAGLNVYNPPTVGFSYRDYWMKTDATWQLLSFPDFKPVANYGVRVTALPDPPLQVDTFKRAANGGFELQLSGPVGQKIAVQASLDLQSWITLGTILFTNRTMPFLDADANQFDLRFYRIIQASEARLAFHGTKRLPDGQLEFHLTGDSGQKFVVQASTDFTNWTPIHTNSFSFTTTERTVVDTQAAQFASRFYRAVAAP